MKENIETVLCIPGYWKNRQVLFEKIVAANSDVIMIDNILYSQNMDRSYEVELYEQDDHLVHSFALFDHIPKLTLREIKKHKSCLYLIGKTGDIVEFNMLMNIADFILSNGGVAIKIETAGTAFSCKQWMELREENSIDSLINMTVSFIYHEDEQFYYSCGMQNIGFPDVKVESNEEEDVYEVMIEFISFLIQEQPSLLSNETFQIDSDSSVFVLEKQECDIYPEDDLFFNPYRIWFLKKR